MLITEEKIDITTSRNFQSLNFGIKNPAFIFKLLCDKIYKNPLKTIVQEYMCNARDAHRELKNEETPIEVYLPNELSSNLIIKDFGPGLSPERIEDVFIYLGESTKRDSNTQTGGFGIGAKVAWAYTDSFTIISFYNNTKTTFLAYTGETGVGKLDMISKVPTDLKNGVEIHIAIKPEDFSKVASYVYRTCLFWTTKPIVYNTISPFIFPEIDSTSGMISVIQMQKNKYNDPDLEWLSWINCIGISPKKIYAVVDGILYNTILIDQYENSNYLRNNYAGFKFFNTGEVDLAVDRETLQMTEKTLLTLDTFKKNIKEYIEEASTKMISDFQTTGDLSKVGIIFNNVDIPICNNLLSLRIYDSKIRLEANTESPKDCKGMLKLDSYRYSSREKLINQRNDYFPIKVDLIILENNTRLNSKRIPESILLQNRIHVIRIIDPSINIIDMKKELSKFFNIIEYSKKVIRSPRIIENTVYDHNNGLITLNKDHLYININDNNIRTSNLVKHYLYEIKKYSVENLLLTDKNLKFLKIPKAKLSKIQKEYNVISMSTLLKRIEQNLKLKTYNKFFQESTNNKYGDTYKFRSFLENLNFVENAKDPDIAFIKNKVKSIKSADSPYLESIIHFYSFTNLKKTRCIDYIKKFIKNSEIEFNQTITQLNKRYPLLEHINGFYGLTKREYKSKYITDYINALYLYNSTENTDGFSCTKK